MASDPFDFLTIRFNLQDKEYLMQLNKDFLDGLADFLFGDEDSSMVIWNRPLRMKVLE